jgi:hypothetical protein
MSHTRPSTAASPLTRLPQRTLRFPRPPSGTVAPGGRDDWSPGCQQPSGRSRWDKRCAVRTSSKIFSTFSSVSSMISVLAAWTMTAAHTSVHRLPATYGHRPVGLIRLPLERLIWLCGVCEWARRDANMGCTGRGACGLPAGFRHVLDTRCTGVLVQSRRCGVTESCMLARFHGRYRVRQHHCCLNDLRPEPNTRRVYSTHNTVVAGWAQVLLRPAK